MSDKPLNTMKYDQDAVPVQLLPTFPLFAIAQGFGYGGLKYEPNSWRTKDVEPVDLTRTYGSVMRHLMKWNAGEELDIAYNAEGEQIGSGLPHLWLAGCQLMILIEHSFSGKGQDSRHIDPELLEEFNGLIPQLTEYLAKMDQHRQEKADG